jgi:hypothetical protein
LASCGAKTGLDVDPGDAEPSCDAGVEPIDPGSCSDEAYALSPERSELEVTIAMDTSGSMDELTADGVPKLDAIRKAVSEFLLDPESEGIAVSMAFFPELRPEVPPSCELGISCGVAGACKSFPACSDDGAACASDADCLPGASCELASWCENSTVCESEAYEPSLGPVELPGGASSIIGAFADKIAAGATPTRPALEGALQAAGRGREQRPDKKGIVLLATDGLPTACDPAIPGPNVTSSVGIPKVVAAAEAGLAEGVQTFVIGVFSPEEEQIAQNNLDAIAIAGGTAGAYVITTDEEVSDRFLDTLNQIRAEASACSFALPSPGGDKLDAKRIAVRITGSSGTLWLAAASALSECHPTLGGYVFDRDPNGTEPPSRIDLCPQSCALLESDPGLALEVVVDCRP